MIDNTRSTRDVRSLAESRSATDACLRQFLTTLVFLLLGCLASLSAHANQSASENAITDPAAIITLHSETVVLPLRLHPSPLAAQVQWWQHDAQTTDSLWLPPEILSGGVEGDPQSWVKLLRLPNGAYLGQIYAFNKMFAVEPNNITGITRVTEQPSLADQNEALMQRIQQSTIENSTSSAPADYLLHPPPPTGLSLTNRNATSDLRTLTGVNVPRILRLGIVVDSRFNDHHGGQGLNRALSLINVIDGIYQQQLGVAIQLEAVVDYTNAQTDPLRNLRGSVENILAVFGNIRQTDPQLPANLTMVHLFTGLRDPDGVLGLGWIGTACRTDGFDVSLSTPFEFDALLAAHEMAHNLGAGHDNTAACASNSSRLMWPRLSSRTQPEFSDCSLLAIAPGIAASCNIDNIDLAISQQLLPSANANERVVRLTATNLDPSRVAPGVRTLIDLPADSSVIDLPANCGAINNSESGNPIVSRLTCLYGDMSPRTTLSNDIRLRILSSSAQQIMRSQVSSPSAGDIQPLNNFVQTNVGSVNTTARPIAAANAANQSNTLNDGGTDELTAGIADSQESLRAGGSASASPIFIFIVVLILLIPGLRFRLQRSAHDRRATA